jgi:hypothetical protein
VALLVHFPFDTARGELIEYDPVRLKDIILFPGVEPPTGNKVGTHGKACVE